MPGRSSSPADMAAAWRRSWTANRIGWFGRDGPPRGIAMRGYFRDVDAPPGRIAFCLNEWVLPGYGWVFPLPDGGANVGVGTLTEGGADEHLRALYERFVGDPASPASAWLGGATPVGRAPVLATRSRSEAASPDG